VKTDAQILETRKKNARDRIATFKKMIEDKEYTQVYNSKNIWDAELRQLVDEGKRLQQEAREADPKEAM
ncbi:hypothetical protein, partial [Acinetobacter baumannii]|uniref:hypothetical protein n=1 Tax=Acinetobacter baumannii TaxID=470 RepID=UPI0024B6F5F6